MTKFKLFIFLTILILSIAGIKYYQQTKIDDNKKKAAKNHADTVKKINKSGSSNENHNKKKEYGYSKKIEKKIQETIEIIKTYDFEKPPRYEWQIKYYESLLKKFPNTVHKETIETELTKIQTKLNAILEWQKRENNKKTCANTFKHREPTTILGKLRKRYHNIDNLLDFNADYKIIKDRVIYVYDGDTVKTHEGSIRLMGINTPEIAHSRNEHDQPGGAEATKFAERELLDKNITIIVDSSNVKDRYGRTVGLIIYDSNKLYNIEVMKAGFAEAKYYHYSKMINGSEWKKFNQYFKY